MLPVGELLLTADLGRKESLGRKVFRSVPGLREQLVKSLVVFKINGEA